MAKNNRSGKIETTIELCRSDRKWKKTIELAEELKMGNSNYECLSSFLIGEGKLESYLEENPPIELNFSKAKVGLSEAKRSLVSVAGDEGRKAGIALDAHLLLAKLFYACGDFDNSLEHFKLAELDNLSEKQLSSRSLRILAESYAVKGLCLEAKTPKGSSKFKTAEIETDMITSFERASDLGLLYLQGQDSASVLSTPTNTPTINEPRHMGAILETALQRSPIVLIKAGKLQEAIERYRCMLSAVETKATQSLRLTLARQLAEVLLRGVSGTIYAPPTSLGRGSGNTGNTSKKLWQPKKYGNRNQFVPRNQQEETILLLLISEALAVRDAVLSQSPEFRIARSHALGNATAVYDLLTLQTVRWGQVPFLHDSLEKALKFAFGEQHVWRQYSLSLISMGRHAQALNALKESIKLAPADTVQLLMLARLCYESMGLIQDGLHYSQEAFRKETKGFRVSRIQLYVGIGLQQISLATNLKAEREQFNKSAFEAFERAVQIDSNDHLAEYYLASQHAINYNIGDALLHIKNALHLRPEHPHSLQLLALLLTANRRPNEALDLVDKSLDEFPDNLHLLQVKAHLELHLKNVDTALITVQKMLLIWKDLYEGQTQNMNGLDHDERYSDTRSVNHFQSSQISEKDSTSVHAASLAAASRVEQALSEAASSLSSFSPRPGPQKAWMIQLKIWLLLADVYLTVELPIEAMNCIQEAALINPMSHQIMYMRGQVHVLNSEWLDAKQCFLNAVSANPYHPEALRALGEAHYILGEPRLAEKILKDAVKIDPNCPSIWFTLGQVMEALGDFSSSADCMATALQLEPACPVLPFTSLNLAFE